MIIAWTGGQNAFKIARTFLALFICSTSLIYVAKAQQEIDPTWFDPAPATKNAVMPPAHKLTASRKTKQEHASTAALGSEPKAEAKRRVGSVSRSRNLSQQKVIDQKWTDVSDRSQPAARR